jgi:hypothetical protein
MSKCDSDTRLGDHSVAVLPCVTAFLKGTARLKVWQGSSFPSGMARWSRQGFASPEAKRPKSPFFSALLDFLRPIRYTIPFLSFPSDVYVATGQL